MRLYFLTFIAIFFVSEFSHANDFVICRGQRTSGCSADHVYISCGNMDEARAAVKRDEFAPIIINKAKELCTDFGSGKLDPYIYRLRPQKGGKCGYSTFGVKCR